MLKPLQNVSPMALLSPKNWKEMVFKPSMKMASHIYWSFLHTLLWHLRIIFPVLVTLMIAFTNYDSWNGHTVSIALLDWTGSKLHQYVDLRSTFRSAFTSVLWLDLLLFGLLAATTLQIELWYLDRYCCQPTIRKGNESFGVIFALPYGCSSLHHDPNFLKYT